MYHRLVLRRAAELKHSGYPGEVWVDPDHKCVLTSVAAPPLACKDPARVSNDHDRSVAWIERHGVGIVIAPVAAAELEAGQHLAALVIDPDHKYVGAARGRVAGQSIGRAANEHDRAVTGIDSHASEPVTFT